MGTGVQELLSLVLASSRPLVGPFSDKGIRNVIKAIDDVCVPYLIRPQALYRNQQL
jgi:hypothetical protein